MERIGYIFSGSEAVYLAKAMGANYIFSMGINIEPGNGDIAEEAKNSLINKNYVFKDFSENYILNDELAELLIPFVDPEKIITARKNTGENDENCVWYIKGERFVRLEQEKYSESRYIFTGGNPVGLIEEDICDEIFDGIDFFGEKGARFVISIDQYRILSTMIADGREENIRFFLQDINIDDKLADEIKDIISAKYGFISLGFFDDYKHRPEKFDYVMYHFTQNGCRRADPDKGEGENIVFSPVTSDIIKRDIEERLKKGFNINVGNRSGLFD